MKLEELGSTASPSVPLHGLICFFSRAYTSGLMFQMSECRALELARGSYRCLLSAGLGQLGGKWKLGAGFLGLCPSQRLETHIS